MNAPEDLVLTRERLRFSDWDAAAEFFMHSPVQRTPSRAVAACADITKSFLGDDAAVLAPSSGEGPAPPHRDGVGTVKIRVPRTGL